MQNDPDWDSDVDVGNLAGRQQNIKVLNEHVQNASKDPNTRFQDDDLGAETSTVDDTAQAVGQPALGSSSTGGVFTGAQPGSVPTPTGGVSTTNVVNDTTENLASKAEGLTQKTMDTLSDKVGVDFGDLSAKEVGTSLAGTLAESGVGEAVGTVAAGLGAIGGALSFLGPIGMIAGLGASIAAIVKGEHEKKEIAEKQANIGTLADNINSTVTPFT